MLSIKWLFLLFNCHLMHVKKTSAPSDVKNKQNCILFQWSKLGCALSLNLSFAKIRISCMHHNLKLYETLLFILLSVIEKIYISVSSHFTMRHTQKSSLHFKSAKKKIWHAHTHACTHTSKVSLATVRKNTTQRDLSKRSEVH